MAVDSQWGNTVLLLPFSESLLDVKGHTVTPVGGAALSSSVGNPFGAGNALYLDGADDYLSLSDSTDWDLSNVDFTAEVWLRTVSHASNFVLIAQCDSSTVNHSFTLEYSTTLGLMFRYTTDGTTLVTVDRSWTPTDGVWYHAAAIRTGTVLHLKIDGSQIGSDYTIGSDTIFNSTSNLRIGATNTTPAGLMNGYIGGVRLTKSSRTITAAPTTPFPRPTIKGVVLNASAAPVAKTILVRDRSTNLSLGGSNSDPTTGAYTFYPPDFGEVQVLRMDELFDPYYGDVVCMSRLNGAGFPTLTGQTLTATGTVTASTAVADPFGGSEASALFTGAGSYLTASGSVSFATKYSISGWFRVTSLTSSQGLAFVGTHGSNASRIQVGLTTSGEIDFYSANAAPSPIFSGLSAAGVCVINTWYYLEAVRDGPIVMAFINGALVLTATASGSESVSGTLYFGYERSGGANRGLDGRLFDVKVSSHVYHTTTFSPPTALSLGLLPDGGSGENALIYDRVIPGG